MRSWGYRRARGGNDGEANRGLPHALARADKRPAVFLDYDGTLTPMLDRPEDALISESMQRTRTDLAERCTVCVDGGRDRRVMQ